MDDDYADGGYTAMTTLNLPGVPMPPQEDDALVMGNPMPLEPRHVTVYANNITPISYNGNDPMIAFDVSFTVSITTLEGEEPTVESYQVVKRIGVDRLKLAAQAKEGGPVAMVEAKQPTALGVVNTARFKTLAGIK